MIDVNFKNIETLAKDHPIKVIYQEATAFIREQEKIVIDWIPSRGKIHFKKDPSARKEFPSGESIPTTEIYSHESGEYSITYSPVAPRVLGNGNKEYPVRNYRFIGKTVLVTKSNIDLLFFLLFVSRFRPPIPEKKKLQNPNFKPNFFEIVDLKKRASVIIEQEETIFKAKSRLFGDNKIEESILRLVAGTMQIPDADTVSIEEVKQRLNVKLFTKGKDDHYNMVIINEFLEMTKGKDDKSFLEIGGLIQTAIDKKVISKVKADGKAIKVTGWYFIQDLKPVDIICAIPVGKKQVEVLSNYLKDNPDVLAVLKAALTV